MIGCVLQACASSPFARFFSSSPPSYLRQVSSSAPRSTIVFKQFFKCILVLQHSVSSCRIEKLRRFTQPQHDARLTTAFPSHKPSLPTNLLHHQQLMTSAVTSARDGKPAMSCRPAQGDTMRSDSVKYYVLEGDDPQYGNLPE